MNPTIEQIGQQRANLLAEAGDLETRVTQLRHEATKLEGVMLFLNQQAQQQPQQNPQPNLTECPKKNPQK